MIRDYSDLICWEAGEGAECIDYVARVNPSDKQIEGFQQEFDDLLESMALTWFQPEELERFTDDDWWAFRERIGI